jgi:hypothetical protein
MPLDPKIAAAMKADYQSKMEARWDNFDARDFAIIALEKSDDFQSSWMECLFWVGLALVKTQE